MTSPDQHLDRFGIGLGGTLLLAPLFLLWQEYGWIVLLLPVAAFFVLTAVYAFGWGIVSTYRISQGRSAADGRRLSKPRR